MTSPDPTMSGGTTITTPTKGAPTTGVPTTFAPVDNIPVTLDYVVGPGDEILIRAWGQVDIDYRAVVDRNGMINIPRVGNVNVAGIRYQELSGYLRTAIGRIFRNFQLNVTLGQLRSIQVFVVGQVRERGYPARRRRQPGALPVARRPARA